MKVFLIMTFSLFLLVTLAICAEQWTPNVYERACDVYEKGPSYPLWKRLTIVPLSVVCLVFGMVANLLMAVLKIHPRA
jgi:hypothetical protein